MPRIKVLVVEGQPVRRKLLVDMLSVHERFVVVGEAADGEEAIAKARELSPDVIVMDIYTPAIGGVEATRLLQTEAPGANVVIYTFSQKEADLYAAMEAGARGYILKSTESAKLVNALRDVAHGKIVVSAEMDRILRPEPATAEEFLQDRKPLVAPRPALRLRIGAGPRGRVL